MVRAVRGRGSSQSVAGRPVPVRILSLEVRGATHPLWSRIRAETEHEPQLPRLANALSALYPRGSGERGRLDAMPDTV